MSSATARWKPVTLEVTPYDINRYQQADLADVVIRATEFFATFGQPMRIITRSEPYSLAAAVASVEARLLGAPGALRDALVAHRRHLEQLDARSELQRLSYHLLVWVEQQFDAVALALAASESFGTPVSVCPAGPLAFRGEYEAELDYLAPAATNREQPYMQALVAYNLQGEWNPYTIHPLLNLGYPFALAQDIYTYPPARAMMALTNAAGALSAQLKAPVGGGPDTKAERSAADCERAMHEVELGQKLHKIAHVLLIKAPTLAELRQVSQMVQAQLGARLQLRVEAGRQQELLEYFGPHPAQQIGYEILRRPILSCGVATMVPFGKRTRSDSDGILLGLEAGGYPIFHQGWHSPGQEDKRAHHRIICGETGYGKTVAVQTWALQEMLLNGAQVVLLEPQGHSQRLIAAVGAEGLYHPISFRDSRINILDVVEDSLPDQITHVEQLLHILLNSTAARRGGAGDARAGTQHTGARRIAPGATRGLWLRLAGTNSANHTTAAQPLRTAALYRAWAAIGRGAAGLVRRGDLCRGVRPADQPRPEPAHTGGCLRRQGRAREFSHALVRGSAGGSATAHAAQARRAEIVVRDRRVRLPGAGGEPGGERCSAGEDSTHLPDGAVDGGAEPVYLRPERERALHS